MQVIFVAIFALTCRDVIAFGPSSDAKHNFKELMAVKWLTCTFEPVELASGQILELIRFDRDIRRTLIVTVPRDESKVEGNFFKPDNFFGYPMTFVFNDAKSRIQLLPPPSDKEFDFTSTVIVQELDWLTPGLLQVTTILSFAKGSGSELVLNVVIYPGKVPKEETFVAIANMAIFDGIIVISARCTDDLSDEIRADVEKIRMELEPSDKSLMNSEKPKLVKPPSSP